MITDLDRDIVTIKYNLLNLPELIQFKEGHQIKHLYDATGKKLETQYVSLVQGVYNPLIPGEIMDGLDVNELDLVTINGTAYIGNMEYNLSRYFDWDVSYAPKSVFTLNRVHNPEGYTTYANLKLNKTGPIYHYYRRDHLGNNREVWQAEHLFNNKPKLASTIQRTQYYPSGLPWKSNTADGAALQPYKYGGKEFVETHGYDSYDFHARNMYPAIMRFTTIDPLAVKYYSISPYAYCLNNPVRFTDPTGCEVDLSQMSDEERKCYESQVTAQRQNSELFNTMYTSLESSKDVYVVKFGQTTSEGSDPVKGQFAANKEGGGTVTFLAGENIQGSVMSEEFFHAYQHDNRGSYGNGEFNVEFEAKVFNTAVGLEYGGFGEFPGMGDFQNKVIMGDYGNGQQIISPQTVVSESFVKDYTNSANSYAKHNRENNHGNSHYRTNTTVAPYSLQRVVIDTYKKK